MKTLSVIVPVYNASAYIERCLQSVEAQTLHDIEVILVDDHGRDDSIAKVKAFVTKSQRKDIHYVFAETPINSGPAAARNIGIEKAQGEYIAFLDADDWIEPKMIEVLYNNASRYNADISSSAAIMDFTDGSHRVMTNPFVGSGLLSDKQRTYILQHYVSNFTTMLFLRSWLQENEISFPHSYSGEDSSFMGMCYLVCRRIAQTDEPLYHYRIHDNSISHRKYVYRGTQKKAAFQALLNFARSKGLLATYRWTLYWIYFKKVIVTSVMDYLR